MVLFANTPLGKTRKETFTPKNPQLGLIRPLKAPKTGGFPQRSAARPGRHSSTVRLGRALERIRSARNHSGKDARPEIARTEADFSNLELAPGQ